MLLKALHMPRSLCAILFEIRLSVYRVRQQWQFPCFFLRSLGSPVAFRCSICPLASRTQFQRHYFRAPTITVRPIHFTFICESIRFISINRQINWIKFTVYNWRNDVSLLFDPLMARAILPISCKGFARLWFRKVAVGCIYPPPKMSHKSYAKRHNNMLYANVCQQ